MISIDRGLLGKGQLGDVLERHAEYGKHVDRLDIIVFSAPGFSENKISQNVSSFPTNSKSKIKVCQVIKKTKKTIPQSQLRRQERLNNLNRAFSIKRPGEIKGKHILLVDDIFTTGSTVNECAQLLKEHGAERVDFFTIARS